MATIGSITVAFSASLDDFEAGVEDVASLLDDLSESVEDISEKIDASSKTMKVKAVVDAGGVEAAKKEIESTSATVKVGTEVASGIDVKVDKEVEKAKAAAETNKISITAEIKDVVAKASEAAMSVKALAKGVVVPIKATAAGVSQAIGAAKQANEAFNLSTDSVTEFAESLLSVGSASKGLQNATVFAFAMTGAVAAGREAYSGAAESAAVLSKSLDFLGRAASDQEFLSRAVSDGASAFIGAGVASAAYKAAMQGVNALTEDLDPKLKAAVRGLAGMALALAQTEAASRIAASSATLIATALKSQASPMAAVSAFAKTYTDGLEKLSEASTAAVDRQRALVRIQNIVSQVFGNAKSTVSSALQPFSTGFERARESGQGYIAAITRGLSGQAQSIGVVRSTISTLSNAFAPFAEGFSRAQADGASFFAALDRGFTGQLNSIKLFRSATSGIGEAFKATGVSSFFEPLIEGFERARDAGDGFTAALIRGVSGQLNSSSAFRALRGAAVSAGDSIYKFGASIIGVNATTKIGRDTFYMLRASMQAIRSTAGDVVGYFSVLKTSFASFTSALPGGKALIEAVSSAMGELSKSSSSLMSSLPSVGSVVQSLAPWLTLASVAGGKFAHSLEEMSVEMQGIEQMADRFGATTGEMQVLAYAAESARVGMGQLAKASQAFLTNVSKVKIGQLNVDTVQEAKFAFDRLGISMEELRNKKPQEVFGLVAEELLAVEDPADRAAIAFDLFGKQAVNILPALKGLKEAAEDANRLGTITTDVDFERLLDAEASFDRVTSAGKNLGRQMLVAFAPLQTGWNNLMADLLGGLVSAIGPMRTLFASTTAPMQVLMEVVGRMLNIVLRLIGVLTTLFAALSSATALAPAWLALGDVIKGLLGYLEYVVDSAQKIATVFSAELNPTIDESATMLEKLGFAAKTFGIIIVSGGVASAVMQTFGIQAGAALAKFAAGLLKINVVSVFSGIIKIIRLLTIDVVKFATKFVASMLVSGVSALAGLLTPMMTTVAMVITGNSAMAVSATATGWAMAAAWVIGTLGLAAIVVAIIAVVQNFSSLYEWFSDFGNNIGRLFTFEGLVEAATAVTEAIKGAFMTMFNGITGFFGGIIQNIIMAVNGIEMPEKIAAASSSVSDVVGSRKKQQTAKFEASVAAADMIGASAAEIEMPIEDTDALTSSITDAREEMTQLSLRSTKFGEAGKKAFLAARADFDKLQQQVADNTLQLKVITDENGVKRTETVIEAFERRSREIKDRLDENLNLADTLSPEALQESAENMRKEVDSAYTKIREVARGQDLGSDFMTDRFFPTSDAIKAKAKEFAKSYEDQLASIESRLQRGDFGKGQDALKAAEAAREQAKSEFDRNMGKIEADTSFANDIRKSLEEAFLTPVEKFKKELAQIQANKSLSEAEKSLATVAAQKQMVEGTFGKSAGSSLREKEAMFAQASATDQYGRNAFMSAEGSRGAGAARESAERNKLDIERRKAVGLDATASQQLKAGADNIADIFGVAGMSIQEIQKELGPEKFAEYQEAIKKNAEAVKASLGVEQTGAQKLADSRVKLDKALADGVISQDEYNKAAKKQKDELLSSLGISKSPAQDFEDAVNKIKENASALTPEEVAKGLKEAKDKLLQSLGIPKSPVDAAVEAMRKLQEAFQKGQISAEEFAKGSLAAKNTLLQSLGIPLDPVSQLRERMNDLRDAFSKGLITQEEFTRGQEEAKRSMLPGSEEESPVKKFKRDMDVIDRAVKEGLIDQTEGDQRKKMIQAQLQEDMKPALDRLAPDRRAVESSDVRSKGGVDTFFRILRGNDNPSLKAQLEIARNTRLLAEAAAEPEAAPVLANMQGR